MAAKQYEVVIGLDHDGGRQEPGEIYKGPAGSVKWLLEQGAITVVGEEPKPPVAVPVDEGGEV